MKAGNLVQVDEDVYYLANGVNLGIIRISENQCAVVDTGLGEDAAKRLLAAAEALGVEITAIINTHAHADHFGGNAYLVKRTGAKVYAPALEAPVMAHPMIEPFYLFGAKPIPELTERFLMGKPSPVDFAVEDGELALGERNLTVLPLPGHSLDQIGVIVEAVCFTADAVFSEEAWRKHVVVYVADVGKTLDSLERLRKAGAREFVPAHTGPLSSEKFGALLDFNVARILDIAEAVLVAISKPTTAEEVLKAVADSRALAITTPQQYHLTLAAVKAYLSYHAENDVARYFLDANRLFWESTE